MTKNWEIRKAVSKDADGLELCMHSAYEGYRKRMGGKQLPPQFVDYVEEINNFPTWVAVHNKTIVGGLTMMFEPSYTTLANIAVSPSFQGQGLGRGLLEFAESIAKQESYSELRLATHILLTENVALYSHFGWIEYNRDETKVYMKKKLN
ncbi:GNAT family N-acetyltransferase [bacterium]|jgi:GNAT superfamily N-acetyltransferase|nr:GNAT family N-acetyltransferase [bacterium]